MSRAAKIIPAFMVSMMVGFFVLLLASSTWALVWMMTHLVMLLCLLLGTETRPGLTLLSWIIPHTHLVRTMDHDGEVRHVLAYGQAGEVMLGHLHWLSEASEIQLHPNGYVKGVSYVYFWEPINAEQLAYMHLAYDCQDWHKLTHMRWTQREDYRQRLKDQSKMNQAHTFDTL